jgi:uncharacterized membrane protein YhhN
LISVSAGMTVAGFYVPGRRVLVTVFKPLTTTLLVVLAATARPNAGGPYTAAIVAGLVFSLAGDVCLMLPSERFKAGLASFLAAHACYIVAFASDSPLARPGFPVLVWAAAGFLVFRLVWPGVPGALRPAVLAYVVVLLFMASQATSRAFAIRSLPAVLAAAGAALFVVSDGLLAIDRFGRPFRAARALVHGTYFAAQWLIAVSVHAAWPEG